MLAEKAMACGGDPVNDEEWRAEVEAALSEYRQRRDASEQDDGLRRITSEELAGATITPLERHWLVDHGFPNRWMLSKWYPDEFPMARHLEPERLCVLGTVDRPFSDDVNEPGILRNSEMDLVCLRPGVPGVWCAPRDPENPMRLLNSSVAQLILTLISYEQAQDESPDLPAQEVRRGFEFRLTEIDPDALSMGNFWRDEIEEQRFLKLTDDIRLGFIVAFKPLREAWRFRHLTPELDERDDEELSRAAQMAQGERQAAVALRLQGAREWTDLYLHDAHWTHATWEPAGGVLNLTFCTCRTMVEPYQVIHAQFAGCTFEPRELEYLRRMFEHRRALTVLDTELDFVAGSDTYVFRLRCWLSGACRAAEPQFAVIFRNGSLRRSPSDPEKYNAAGSQRPVFVIR